MLPCAARRAFPFLHLIHTSLCPGFCRLGDEGRLRWVPERGVLRSRGGSQLSQPRPCSSPRHAGQARGTAGSGRYSFKLPQKLELRVETSAGRGGLTAGLAATGGRTETPFPVLLLSLAPRGSCCEPRTFSEPRLPSSSREDAYPNLAGLFISAGSPLSHRAVVVATAPTAASPIITIKPVTLRGPRSTRGPRMPRGACAMPSQPGRWGGGRGSVLPVPPGVGTGAPRDSLADGAGTTSLTSLVLPSVATLVITEPRAPEAPATGCCPLYGRPGGRQVQRRRPQSLAFHPCECHRKVTGWLLQLQTPQDIPRAPRRGLHRAQFLLWPAEGGAPLLSSRVLWGVALLGAPLRRASQPGVLPSGPLSRLPEGSGRDGGLSSSSEVTVCWFDSLPVDG